MAPKGEKIKEITFVCVVIAVASAPVSTNARSRFQYGAEEVSQTWDQQHSGKQVQNRRSGLPPPFAVAGPYALRLAAALRAFDEVKRGVDGRIKR